MYDNREIVKFEGRREGGLRMHSIFATLNSSKKSMFAIIRLQCRIAHIFFSSTYTRFFLLRSACQWCNFFFSHDSLLFFFFFFSLPLNRIMFFLVALLHVSIKEAISIFLMEKKKILIAILRIRCTCACPNVDLYI